MFNFFKKKKKHNDANPPQKRAEDADKSKNTGINTKEMLDDISYIREIKHIHGAWQQYDVI